MHMTRFCKTILFILSLASVSQSQTEVQPREGKLDLKLRSERDWFYTALEINYVVLNTLDLVTTFEGMSAGAREANPVARLYISNKPAAVLIKGATTTATLMALSHVKRQNKPAAYITLGVLNVCYGLVVGNNIGVYFELNK